ncbi:MAG: group II truncated hemoglobin [Halieaceae bacterium]
MEISETDREYGKADATFKAAGGEVGVRALVDAFYDIMGSEGAYREIWIMHPEVNEVSRDKLARFLCAWTGGPRLYAEKYGAISIPGVHAHLAISSAHRDQWLGCMEQALKRCDYPQEFQQYMLAQLAVPAERIRTICEKNLDD